MTLQEEYVLSCYETLCRMEEGKEVYLVRNQQDGHFYIKKVLHHYSKSLYEKLKQLQISGIPKIYHCIEEKEQLIVMEEFIQGHSLQELYDEKGAFSEEEVRNIGWQLCQILKSLHACQPPLIHRDIKPSNVLYSNDKVLYLIDFDAAKEYTEGKTRDTVFMGTPEFAAPEQYGFGQSDARTDIYAVGVLMNELLTGKSPTACLTPGKMRPVIEKCCYLEASKRFASVEELAKALRPQTDFDVEGKTLYSPNPSFPVGFRKGNPVHILIGTFGYLILGMISFGLTIENAHHDVLTGIPLCIYRIGCFLMGMGTILFCGNYMDIWEKCPGMQKGSKKKVICGMLYLMAYWVILFILISILTG